MYKVTAKKKIVSGTVQHSINNYTEKNDTAFDERPTVYTSQASGRKHWARGFCPKYERVDFIRFPPTAQWNNTVHHIQIYCENDTVFDERESGWKVIRRRPTKRRKFEGNWKTSFFLFFFRCFSPFFPAFRIFFQAERKRKQKGLLEGGFLEVEGRWRRRWIPWRWDTGPIGIWGRKQKKMIEESGQDQREYERRKLFLKNTIWRRNNNDNNIKNNKFQQGPIRQWVNDNTKR